MTIAHEAIAALPVGADANAALIRAMATRRMAYVFADSEDVTTFVAVDPDAGTVPLYLVQNGSLFKYDSTDTTTVHDGVTCLVTSDGKRYKTAVVDYPWSVLTQGTTAQPVSPAPSVGDRYLVPNAATGTDWAGKDGKVAIYTAAGWQFATVPVGRLLHIEDETAFYHRNPDGVWTAGVGDIVITTDSIPLSAMIGLDATFVLKVENQTTNTPPGSPTLGVAYIIGSSPTGSWAGNPGKIARCEVAGSFTIYTPIEGDSVWDKNLNALYTYNGSAWTSGAGAWVKLTGPVLTTSGSTAGASSDIYTYSNTVAPTTSHSRIKDNATISHTAAVTGAKLRLRYSAAVDYNTVADTFTGTATSMTVAVFRNNESNAIVWRRFAVYSTFEPPSIDVEFHFTALDTNSNTYTIAFTSAKVDGSNIRTVVLSRRSLTIEEAA